MLIPIPIMVIIWHVEPVSCIIASFVILVQDSHRLACLDLGVCWITLFGAEPPQFQHCCLLVLRHVNCALPFKPFDSLFEHIV
jgi:hypothetical protein